MAALDGDGDLGGTRFDASQYAFFGNDSVHEVELGGLDEEEENNNSAFGGIDEELRPSYSDSKFEGEGEGLVPFSDADDLSSTFSKLNRLEPRTVIDPHARTFSRESSAPSDFHQRWSDPHFSLDSDPPQIPNQFPNQLPPNQLPPNQMPPNQMPPNQLPPNQMLPNQFLNSLTRTASHPQQIAPQNLPTNSDPIPIPQNPNFLLRPHLFSSPPPQNPNFPTNPNFHPSPPQNPNFPSNPNFLPSPPKNPNFFPNPNNPSSPQNPNFFPNPNNPSPPQNPNFPPNPNSPLRPHIFPPQMFHSPPHHQLHPDFRPPYRARPNYAQTRFDSQTQTRYETRYETRYLSKHMTVEEIEHISRTQHNLTHGSDPYIDDYYHQACLAQKSKSTHGPKGPNGPLHHRFCPTVIRDPASRTRSRDEPHAFLQVEALGRLPFSSIRRPRPLLDVDLGTKNDKNDDKNENNKVRLLEEEPLLAARITVEDAMNLILDIDDIDRVLRFTQVPDNGFPLRRKRQAILEEILGSLHLVDPLRPGTNTDDFVFLRIVSLPKGRKLLARYIEVASESAELARVVCMAVFRHLRFLFGNPEPKTGTEKTLAGTVSRTVSTMDLSALSACLAAVVCSNEQPPLRPIGNPAGDGASIALKTALDRATELLTKNPANYSAPHRALWQASFDAFFNLLARYCTGKYDSIVAQFGRIAGREIGREIPVELLRASLPHTDEGQRRVLIDFAQRSLPVEEFVQRSNVSNVGAVPS